MGGKLGERAGESPASHVKVLQQKYGYGYVQCMYIVHVGSVQICIKVIISLVGAGGMAMKGSELFYQLAVGKRIVGFTG